MNTFAVITNGDRIHCKQCGTECLLLQDNSLAGCAHSKVCEACSKPGRVLVYWSSTCPMLHGELVTVSVDPKEAGERHWELPLPTDHGKYKFICPTGECSEVAELTIGPFSFTCDHVLRCEHKEKYVLVERSRESLAVTKGSNKGLLIPRGPRCGHTSVSRLLQANGESMATLLKDEILALKERITRKRVARYVVHLKECIRASTDNA